MFNQRFYQQEEIGRDTAIALSQYDLLNFFFFSKLREKIWHTIIINDVKNQM